MWVCSAEIQGASYVIQVFCFYISLVGDKKIIAAVQKYEKRPYSAADSCLPEIALLSDQRFSEREGLMPK